MSVKVKKYSSVGNNIARLFNFLSSIMSAVTHHRDSSPEMGWDEEEMREFKELVEARKVKLLKSEPYTSEKWHNEFVRPLFEPKHPET